MRISLGANPYYWSMEDVAAFYEQVQDWPVDIVYLGETVCSKRRPYGLDGWIDLARMLAAKGKEVVLSTLTLIEARSEVGTVKRLVENGEFMVEASDMAAVQLAAERGLPFATGPSVNIYNAQTLATLQRAGLQRWVAPTELPRDGLAALLEEAEKLNIPAVETEIFAYGRIPLAYSARCFTARAHNLPKDQCEFRCQDYPEGLPVQSQEDQGFVQINGIQLQSGERYNLLSQWPEMQAMGVNVMRISPQPIGTGEVIAALRGMLDQGRTEAPAEFGGVNGYWFAQPGMDTVPAAEA